MNSAIIVGIGAALPSKCVKNSELPRELNTSDEWIFQRTGIKQRYLATEMETTASLATEAAKNALLHAQISAQEVDLIIVATATGDYIFPATATLVQRDLKITQGAAFDVGAVCSGFIFALDVADSFIKSGKSQCALVIGAETFSRILDWSDRSTCVLFGDGAGAVVLKSWADQNYGIRSCKIYSDGKFADHLMTSGGVSTNREVGFVKMQGREVFRYAVEKFQESLEELLKDNSLKIEDIDLLVPHQANSRIINKLIEISGIDEKKVLITVEKHANTSAASIPLALNEVKDDIFLMKNVVLLSMGAGFTWGSALINFDYRGNK
ncbi:MAG: ketoacyl-ACP synthase III [Holosporaceae bacterium]|jgi:3-oxoacyl-[acyl-carrier-protein] synthase-3|nr:ketoacyl-ACP synthase III [Holosporaceae bacterium]